MKSLSKKAILLCLFLVSVLCLTSCGDGREEFIHNLVAGNINEVYLGEFDEEYLEMVSTTKEEAEQIYLDGLKVEAEYFVNYWGIVSADNNEDFADLEEDLQNDIINLYKKIYSYTKYEIVSVDEQEDGNYSVKVLVDPINIMEQALELYESDEYEQLNKFWAEYESFNFSEITQATYTKYWEYTNEYGRIIVQMISDLLPSLEYAEQKSQLIQVESIDGVWCINTDDWSIFDTYVINYP